jgi:cytochrome P450 family 6
VFDENMIAAQVCVFFLGGFETAATSMSFCLYELSLNQDVQRRLREEIDHVLKEHKGHFTYNALEQMEYLDHVVAGQCGISALLYTHFKRRYQLH